MRYHFIHHPHPRTQHSPRPAQSWYNHVSRYQPWFSLNALKALVITPMGKYPFNFQINLWLVQYEVFNCCSISSYASSQCFFSSCTISFQWSFQCIDFCLDMGLSGWSSKSQCQPQLCAETPPSRHSLYFQLAPRKHANVKSVQVGNVHVLLAWTQTTSYQSTAWRLTLASQEESSPCSQMSVDLITEYWSAVRDSWTDKDAGTNFLACPWALREDDLKAWGCFEKHDYVERINLSLYRTVIRKSHGGWWWEIG